MSLRENSLRAEEKIALGKRLISEGMRDKGAAPLPNVDDEVLASLKMTDRMLEGIYQYVDERAGDKGYMYIMTQKADLTDIFKALVNGWQSRPAGNLVTTAKDIR